MKGAEKATLRLLRFLREGPARAVPVEGCVEGALPGCLMLRRADHSSLLAAPDVALAEELVRRDGDAFVLTAEGRAHLARREADGDFAAQHRASVRRTVEHGGTREAVTVNTAESPLARLRLRTDKRGRTWLGDEAFEAGERLRRDFTLGAMEQKVTASWDPTASVNRGGGRGAKADLSESAIDARRRMEGALATLGPDLAGVALDVCCFLKGLERVERERRWPPRSAKLMLRTALDLLARHYGTLAGQGARRRGAHRWGADGYRPTLT